MTNVQNHLGRLDAVPLRNVWPSEAENFTPWLAREDSLALLGDTIGVELALEAQEKEVGPYRADILCRDTANGQWVVIENQLEKTNHDHLGKLLTYAAGLKAVTIVWIADYFVDEHRAAIDWLNDITESNFNFFGIEVELWRIGDSKMAPRFNIVSQPNDWNRAVRAINTSHTETQQLQLEYWTAFHSYLVEKGANIKPSKPAAAHSLRVSVGRSGFWLGVIASRWDSNAQSWDSDELRVELVLQDERAVDYFKDLEQSKDEIERQVGQPLVWQRNTEKRCSVSIRRSTDLDNREDWPDQHAWLLENIGAFHRVFAPRVKLLGKAAAASV